MARVYLSPPHLAGRETELVTEAIASNWIAPLGPHVDAFEDEVAAAAGASYAVALSSGTAALHLALVVLGIGPGDEVACSDFTFAASANPIIYTGAVPVFVDADSATWTIDPELLDRAISSRRAAGGRVRAVIAVDLYGQCCDYDALREVCARHEVVLLQDATESLGATYRDAPAGAQGTLAAFSFNGNKIITTSGGGMLVSDDRDWIEHARKLSTQAREPVAALRARRDRVQLPHEQPPGCARPRSARDPPGAGGGTPAHPRPLPRAARRGPGDLLHAGGGARHVERLAHVRRRRPRRLRRRPRGDPPGARGRGHRGAATLEADAPAAGLRLARGVRRRRRGAAVRPRSLPAERLGFDRTRSRTAWSRPCSLRAARASRPSRPTRRPRPRRASGSTRRSGR